MKGLKYLIFLIVMLLFGSIAFGGTVVDVQGKAEALINGKWVPVVNKMDVKDGTKLMTGVGSSMKVQAKAGYFIMREMSMVTYGETVYENSVDQKVSIDVGKVRVRYDKVEGVKSSFKVQTPKGTASVRGTEEEVGFYPTSGMSIEVVEGSINVMDNNGSSFVSTGGEKSGVSSNGKLFGESDVLETDAGLNNFFSDNDTQNSFINDTTTASSQENIPKLQNPNNPNPVDRERL